jgi:hypothetical protein
MLLSNFLDRFKRALETIKNVTYRSEGTECLTLSSVEHRDQRGNGEGDGGEDDDGALASELADDRLSSGELGTDGGDNGNHGKTRVDDLRGRAAEGHEVTEAESGGGGSGRGDRDSLGDGAVLNSVLPLQKG